jgi:hypothetical protein
MRPRLSGARWVGLLLLLTALFYWKLAFSNRFTFIDSPDIAGQVLPWYEVQAKAWNDGIFPLWDPYVWAGQPLLGQMQPGGAFPLNWPLFAAPLGSDGHIRYRFVHIQRVLIHLLAALFAYALARELEFSNIAAVFAGLAFTCGGWVGSVVWPQMLNGAIWLPLTLMLFHRAARQQDRSRGLAYAVLCGGSVGMSLLSGHHQAPFFSLLALGGVFLYLLIERLRQDREAAISLAVIFGVTGVVSFLVAGLQLLPAFEYGGEALRWVNAAEPVGRGDRVPYYVHHALRLELVTLMGMVTPRLHTHVNTFVGWTALALALYAVASCWKQRWVKAYALLAILSLSYASGTFSLLQGWAYEFIPEAHTARTSAYAVFVTQLAIFVLAAKGLDYLMRQSAEELTASPWIRRGQILLVSYAAMTYTTLFARAMWGHMDPDPADNVTLSAVIALLLAACLHAYKKGDMTAKVFAGTAVALLLAETYGTQFYDITDIDDPTRRANINRLEEEFREPMEFLVSQTRPGERFRYAVSSDLGGTNVGPRWGLEQTGGFLASVNRDLFEMYVAMDQTEFYRVTNTKYFIGRTPHDSGQIERFTARNGIKVYENPETMPRAWISYSNEFISDARFDASGLERVSGCEPGGLVRQVAWTIQSTTLEVETHCPGYVVLADAFFPGWQAAVNGEDVPVLRYRGGLRAVHAPAGRSTIEFEYRPSSAARGAWMTGFGFLLCCAAGFWLRFRAPRPANEPA